MMGEFFLELLKKQYKSLKARDLPEILFSKNMMHSSWLYRSISYLTDEQLKVLYDISRERGVSGGWKEVIKRHKSRTPFLLDIERTLEREHIAQTVATKKLDGPEPVARKRKM